MSELYLRRLLGLYAVCTAGWSPWWAAGFWVPLTINLVVCLSGVLYRTLSGGRPGG